mgnify:CR=1 FL=1
MEHLRYLDPLQGLVLLQRLDPLKLLDPLQTGDCHSGTRDNRTKNIECFADARIIKRTVTQGRMISESLSAIAKTCEGFSFL